MSDDDIVGYHTGDDEDPIGYLGDPVTTGAERIRELVSNVNTSEEVEEVQQWLDRMAEAYEEVADGSEMVGAMDSLHESEKETLKRFLEAGYSADIQTERIIGGESVLHVSISARDSALEEDGTEMKRL